jgi:hypothetical protein
VVVERDRVGVADQPVGGRPQVLNLGVQGGPVAGERLGRRRQQRG